MAVPQEATDEALVSRAALGDNHAFDEITIRYQARVYRLACRLVGHDDVVESLRAVRTDRDGAPDSTGADDEHSHGRPR